MRRVVLAAVLLLGGLAPRVDAAVEEYLGKPIAAVRVDIEGRATTDFAIVDVIETRVGRPLSMIEARESIAHLFSLGRFEDVRLHADTTAAGVALRYELVPIHHVAKIEFRGNRALPGVDDGRLRRAVVDRYGVSPAVGRAAEIARTVRDTLRQSGYLHATVSPGVELEHRPERATLAFTIDPGPRTRIGTVDIVGTPSIPVPDLVRRLKLTRGDPFEREHLDERIEAYVESRRAHGFYESRLLAGIQLVDSDRVANITLNAVPGPKVRVVFTGDSLPSDRRAELVPVEREGSVDEDLLEDSSHRIEEFLRAEGYRDAKATFSRQQQEKELVITFDVRRGPQYRVEHVEVTGNSSIPLSTIAPLLHAREHQALASATVDADVTTIENLYRRDGFGGVRVQPGVEPQQVVPNAAIVPVAVRYAIAEGVRTVVKSVAIEGNESVPGQTLRNGIGLQPGRPFFAPQAAADRDAIQTRYADLGYPSAMVEVNPDLSADGSEANVVFSIQEGPRILIDHILIVGNVRTSTATIQRELQLKPGDPMGIAAVNDSQRRLAALGLFRSVRITELRHGGENRRDLLVTLEEAPATTVSWGGGFEVQSLPTGLGTQQLELAPRASFSIGRRNLFGKNRSVDLFSSLSMRPTDPTKPDQGYDFAEYRLIGTFREPRVLNTNADAFITGTMEQQRRASFDFSRRSVTADIGRRITRSVSLTGSYQFQTVSLFNRRFNPNDALTTGNPIFIDLAFPQVRLSLFSVGGIRDTRNDPLDPTSGSYWSMNGEVAGRAIGSEVGFAKSFMTAQSFRQLPGRRRIVLAGNARVGLAAGFPRPGIDPSTGHEITVKDLPASERFFAGGDTSVRGFALDSLGTPATISKDTGFPIGGNALVILNGEARVQVHGGLGVVGFIDTGNVFASVTDVAIGELRSAAGFGMRYKSPVGPIRVDLGFNLHPRQLANGQFEQRRQLWISLGQSF